MAQLSSPLRRSIPSSCVHSLALILALDQLRILVGFPIKPPRIRHVPKYAVHFASFFRMEQRNCIGYYP